MDQLVWASRFSGFDLPRLVRPAVFVEEQGFSQEFDSLDDRSLHLSLWRDGQPAGCARLYRQEGIFRLGRVAVLPPFRRQGLGRLLVGEAEEKAARLGGRVLRLGAQCQAIPFYEQLGYRPVGEPYLDEHCPHQEMERAIGSPAQPQVDWFAPGEPCPQGLALRRRVFGEELGVREDDAPVDRRSHLLLLSREGRPLACARLTPWEGEAAKFSRLAVDPACRGEGLGTLLLENLGFRALELGFRQGWLSAREAVLPFYRKAGFSPKGEPFREEGELHQQVGAGL